MTDRESNDWITVARVTKTQGRRGELKAELLTDFPDRFSALQEVYLTRPGRPRQRFALQNHWLHKGGVVLSLDGIADMTGAAAWVGAEVQIPWALRVTLPEGTYFVSDLEECGVWQQGRLLGKVSAIEFVPNAPALMHVDAAGSESGNAAAAKRFLIPFAKDYLLRVAIEERRIEVELPDGLLEI